MLSIEPSGGPLGATIRGADLSKPLNEADVGRILSAVGRYNVLRFPDQNLTTEQQLVFARHFGKLKKKKFDHIREHPEITVLSNIVENGQPIGAFGAGVIWHRDMTYQKVPGFANFLYAVKVPRRNGRPLGETQFVDSQSAYDDLPGDVKNRLDGAIGLHSGRYYTSIIRAAFSIKLAEGHKGRHHTPPLGHPIVMTHPITGRKVLFCDTGHVERIEGLKDDDDGELLNFLNEHQLQTKYLYTYTWTEGDLVMWDNIGSLHRAVIDFTADEPRLIKRCQTLSDKIFDPAFVKAALKRAGGALTVD